MNQGTFLSWCISRIGPLILLFTSMNDHYIIPIIAQLLNQAFTNDQFESFSITQPNEPAYPTILQPACRNQPVDSPSSTIIKQLSHLQNHH